MKNNLIVLKELLHRIEQYLFHANILIFGIPFAEVILVVIILIMTQLFNGIFTRIILRKIGKLTRHTLFV
jgi:hypothetical protein